MKIGVRAWSSLPDIPSPSLFAGAGFCIEEMSVKDENAEKIGTLADELDAVLFTSKLPLPPQLHLSSLQEKVREARDILAAVFKDETGDDPWEDNPLVG